MTSAIDPTKPSGPMAYTADVRANFQAAHDEITALQGGGGGGGDYLPLDGSKPMTGPLQVPAGSASDNPPLPMLEIGSAGAGLYSFDNVLGFMLPTGIGMTLDPGGGLSVRIPFNAQQGSILGGPMTCYDTATLYQAVTIYGATRFYNTVTLDRDPVAPTEAATKQYVDANAVPLDGSVPMTGTLTTGGTGIVYGNMTPAFQGHTVSFGWSGSAIGYFVDNIFLDTILGQSGASQTYVQLSGSTPMTGPLTLGADPTQAMQATTKQYVDAKLAALEARIEALTRST